MAKQVLRLTKQQVDHLRVRLEEERRRILDTLRTAPDVPRVTPEEEPSEFEEAAQRTAERNDALDIVKRERALLTDVDHALERLRAGTYGLDEQSGEPIPYARLEAVPWARGGVDE